MPNTNRLSMYLNMPINKWEEIYVQNLLGFLTSNKDESEIDYLKLLEIELENYRDLRLNENELKQRVKNRIFKNIPFDSYNKDHTDHLEIFFKKEIEKQKNEINKADLFSQFIETKKNRLGIKKEKSKKSTFEGKKFNISERYELLKELFNAESLIRNLNINSEDKNILLSIILDCNQQTARELFNGTHQKRTKVREDLFSRYVNTLK